MGMTMPITAPIFCGHMQKKTPKTGEENQNKKMLEKVVKTVNKQ
jgi:hypothetical protein